MKQTTLTKLSNWPLCAFLRTRQPKTTTATVSVGFLGRIPPCLAEGRLFFSLCQNVLQKPAAGEKNGVQNGWTIFRPPPWPLQSKNCESNFWVFSQSIMQNLFWRRVPDTVVYFFVFSVIFFRVSVVFSGTGRYFFIFVVFADNRQSPIYGAQN